MKNKLKTAKLNFSKTQTRCTEEFEKFRMSKDAPRKRQARCAGDALKNLNLIGKKLKIVMIAGENLISEIDDQGTKADYPEERIKSINSEIDTYEEKLKEFMTKNDGIIQEAEAALSNEGPGQSQQVTSERSCWRAFKPQPSLKPAFLEKES